MNVKTDGKKLIGPILVLVGLMMLFGAWGGGPGAVIGRLWPVLFVLPVGILFHAAFVLGWRMPGLLVPGGVLVTVAIVSQIATLFDAWHVMWPGFILAPAVGLAELYLFGGRHPALLIPVAILACVSLSFFLVMLAGRLPALPAAAKPAVAVAIIAAGAWLLAGKKRR
jgi:hypothetical protein